MLDPTFGNGGKDITNFPSSNVDWVFGPHSVAIQADGKIIVAEYNSSGSGPVRYNSNGTLDISFGPNHDGFVSIPGVLRRRLAVLPDGIILLAGTAPTQTARGRISPSPV